MRFHALRARSLWLAGSFWSVAILCVAVATDCLGQPRPAAQPAASPSSESALADSVFIPAQRSVVLLLDRTRALLNDGRYAEAVQCLDRILSGKEDFFFKPDASTSVHRSIKSEARRLLGSIPPSGRQSYELQYGAFARSSLDEAVESGNIPLIANVARRFFHTEAGYEATFLLGLHHMDHGRPLVAALTLRRLRDESSSSGQFEPLLSLTMARSWLGAGMPVHARETLDALRDHYGDRPVAFEGGDTRLFDNTADSVDQLLALLGPRNAIFAAKPADWTLHGGSPQRIAVSQGSRPLLNPRWRIPTTDDPAVEAMVDRLRRQQEERETFLLPGLHPLVVNDVVLMRTATNLLAVDFETGKRLWEVPANDPFEEALNPPPDGHVNPQQDLEPGLRLRLWGDSAFGTLSSDGQLVFAVEDLQLPSSAIYSRVLLAPGGMGSSAGSLLTNNRLAAFDIRSEGKLRWEVGGPRSEKPLPLAGAFFLGPPLPLLGDLYVLAEMEGEVRLVALSAQNGDLLWQQQLAVVDQSIFHDTLRRVSGVSPSYADGVLVCPTSHHSIVALELTTRSLLWGSSYADMEREDQRGPDLLGAARHRTANPEERWIDSTLVIADGRVLATPVDSEQLHCLSLYDGKFLWRVPRQDKLYIAAVDDGKVVIATRRGLMALQLEDGKSAWEIPLAACPVNSEPSGRGFSDGELYYLPLTGGKLMTVHLATGRVEQVISSRHGHTLGNLVCHTGKIISQRADGIESYYQLDALRAEVDERLAAQPNDARALALRGEVLWDDGRLDDAVECLRKSLHSSDSVRTRSLLREAMFDGLKQDFVRYHAHRDEIESLLDSADDWATFYRLTATGWEDAGEYNRALAEYHALVDLDLQENMFVKVDEAYSVRQDRWIRTRLLRLAEAAPPEVGAELLRWSDEALKGELLTTGPNGIARVLRYFDGLPGTQDYRDEWIDRLTNTGCLAEAELALMHQMRDSDGSGQSRSIARWMSMLVKANRPEDAASLLTEIETRWPDVPFGEGQDGRQWALEFERDHETVRRSRRPAEWPRGFVKASVAATERGRSLPSYGPGFIPFQNSKGLFCNGMVIEHQQHEIVARNGFGQVEWRFSLREIAQLEQLAASRALMRVDPCGHLLIFSLANLIVALDTLATEEDGTPTVAWIESVEGVDAAGLRSHHMFQARMQNMRGQFGGSGLIGPESYPPGTALVLGEKLICVKRFRACAALDPATGQTLWERDGISTQSTIFGDDQYVLIAPRHSTEAMVLRADDGAELESRTIPPEEQRLATMGRRILCWEPVGREYHLKMMDPFKAAKESVVWGPYPFHRNAKYQILDREAIAILTPEGKFQLIRLADGHRIVDAQLEPEDSLTDVVVLRSGAQYVLIANNSVGPRDPRRHVSQVAGLKARGIGKARIYAFDSQGTSIWEKPTVVEKHCLPLIQPSGVPCLTFACMVYKTIPGQPGQPRLEVLCLDTRTGKIVAQQNFAHASHTLEISAVPEESRVEIGMQQETLSLQFTDEPAPEESQSEDAAIQVPSNPLEAIRRATRAVLGGGTAPARDVPRQLSPEASSDDSNRPKAGDLDARSAAPSTGNGAKAAEPATEDNSILRPPKVLLPPPLAPAVRDRIPPARLVPHQ